MCHHFYSCKLYLTKINITVVFAVPFYTISDYTFFIFKKFACELFSNLNHQIELSHLVSELYEILLKVNFFVVHQLWQTRYKNNPNTLENIWCWFHFDQKSWCEVIWLLRCQIFHGIIAYLRGNDFFSIVMQITLLYCIRLKRKFYSINQHPKEYQWV